MVWDLPGPESVNGAEVRSSENCREHVKLADRKVCCQPRWFVVTNAHARRDEVHALSCSGEEVRVVAHWTILGQFAMGYHCRCRCLMEMRSSYTSAGTFYIRRICGMSHSADVFYLRTTWMPCCSLPHEHRSIHVTLGKTTAC